MKIALIPGEGIGPEITEAAVEVLAAVGFRPEWERVELGEAALDAHGDPLPRKLLDKIRMARVALKGPLGTPDGAGYRSVNVALRTKLGLYANVRPVMHYLPESGRPWKGHVDLVVMRENSEGLYVGIERVTRGSTERPERVVAEQVVTRSASRRIACFGLRYARQHHRRKIIILHKANILKHADGLFLAAAREALSRSRDIAVEDMHIDAAGEQLTKNPAEFDVVVTTNLYGDFFSSTAAGLVGGAALAPSANIGSSCAVFEATHGTAPPIAGKGIANPTALILSAAMMLEHLGMSREAERIRSAIRRTFSDGVLTRDIGGTASCAGFTRAFISRL